MRTFLAIAAVSAILFLSGCASTQHIAVDSKPVNPVVINPSPPTQLNLRPVVWMVLNKKGLEDLLKKSQGKDVVLFALSSKQYENLSLNMEDILRYIKDQKAIILYYRKSFATADKSKDQSK